MAIKFTDVDLSLCAVIHGAIFFKVQEVSGSAEDVKCGPHLQGLVCPKDSIFKGPVCVLAYQFAPNKEHWMQVW